MAEPIHPYYLQIPLPRALHGALKALAASQGVSLRTLVHALLAQAAQAPPADLRTLPYAGRVEGTGQPGAYQAPGATPEAFAVESLPSLPIESWQALPEEPGLLVVLGEEPRAVLYIAHALSLRHYQRGYVHRVTAWQATRIAWLVLPVEHLVEREAVLAGGPPACLRPAHGGRVKAPLPPPASRQGPAALGVGPSQRTPTPSGERTTYAPHAGHAELVMRNACARALRNTAVGSMGTSLWCGGRVARSGCIQHFLLFRREGYGRWRAVWLHPGLHTLLPLLLRQS